MINGIINLNKPPGISSARAVGRIKHCLPRGVKIGHAGTLDPFATGVLLVLIGNAVKQSQSLMELPKTYLATVKLGANTETDDPESTEVIHESAQEPSMDRLHSALSSLIGTVSQRPPIYCALKFHGRRAADLARGGRPVQLAPRLVRIDGIELISWQWPLLKLRVDCGKGTYIRSIARDLGDGLQTGGYLTELCRTRIGSFEVERAVTLESVERDGPEIHLQASIAR